MATEVPSLDWTLRRAGFCNSLTKREQQPEGLSALFAKIADELTQLFDTKLALLRVEIKEEVSAYIRGAITIVAGGVVVVVGFALLNVAIAFRVSTAFESSGFSQPVRYALGFIITSLVYLIGGVVIAKRDVLIAARQHHGEHSFFVVGSHSHLAAMRPGNLAHNI